MRKRRVYAVVVGVAVLVGLMVLGFGREREPEYGGKKLSEWVVSRPWWLRTGPVDELTEPAQAAIRQIGSNAIPYLLRWMRYERPPWKTKLYSAVNPTLRRLHAAWQLNDRPKQARAEGAAQALNALGSQAKRPIPELAIPQRSGLDRAIPELAHILNDPTARGSAERAAHVLGSLGRAGRPALFAACANSDPRIRRRALDELRRLDRRFIYNQLPDPPPVGTNPIDCPASEIDWLGIQKAGRNGD